MSGHEQSSGKLQKGEQMGSDVCELWGCPREKGHHARLPIGLLFCPRRAGRPGERACLSPGLSSQEYTAALFTVEKSNPRKYG